MRVNKGLCYAVTKRNKLYVTRKDAVDMVGDEYKKLIYDASNSNIMGWPKAMKSKTAVKLYLKTSVEAWIKNIRNYDLQANYDTSPAEGLLINGKSSLYNDLAQKFIRALPPANL